MRKERGGKEKEWTDCVQSDIRAFGIAGDWKAPTLEAEVWVETVTESGWRFMAARRKEEVDAARHRQEKREATTLRKLLSYRHIAQCISAKKELFVRNTATLNAYWQTVYVNARGIRYAVASLL